MTEDQRFAATRPDVLVYKGEVLDHDVSVVGPITVDLKVSTTGTDSDFVVKLIDVYPAITRTSTRRRLWRVRLRRAANAIKMGGLSATGAGRTVPRQVPPELFGSGCV